MAQIKQTTTLDAIIAAQQDCQKVIDQVTVLDDILSHLDGILEQINRTPSLSFSVKASLNAAIVEFDDVADSAINFDLWPLESLLESLRRAVEQAQ